MMIVMREEEDNAPAEKNLLLRLWLLPILIPIALPHFHTHVDVSSDVDPYSF